MIGKFWAKQMQTKNAFANVSHEKTMMKRFSWLVDAPLNIFNIDHQDI